MLPLSLGVLVMPVKPSRFPGVGWHPRHWDVVGAGEEALTSLHRHWAWGSPRRSRMGWAGGCREAGR